MRHDAAQGLSRLKSLKFGSNLRISVKLAGPTGPRAMRHDAAQGLSRLKSLRFGPNLRISVELAGPKAQGL